MPRERTRILTLVHVSDLHFGNPSAEEGAPPPTFWRWTRLFDGLLGHHKDALIHLTTFVKDLRRSERHDAERTKTERPVHVIVSGDLTACGKKTEFDRALMFLRSHTLLGANCVGLAEPEAMARTIPGNHDHWPGTRRIVGRSEHLAEIFPQRPIPTTRLQLPNGCELVMFGIDSDFNVAPHSLDRVRARGRFLDQLLALEARVTPSTEREIRVLLVHHSPAHEDRYGTLMIEKDTRRALEEWVKRAGVSVILTGHVHLPGPRLQRVSDRGVAWGVLEARCGTTTQLDRLPLNWVAAGTAPSERARGRPKEDVLSDERPRKNTLLVHRLYDTGRTIEWECELFVRLHHGFKSLGPLKLSHGADGDRPVPPLVVWPRGIA